MYTVEFQKVFVQLVIMLLLFRFKMADNPWNVADATMFLKYCCPECDYQITHLNIFEVHATTQHELSSIFFENIEIAKKLQDPLTVNGNGNGIVKLEDTDIKETSAEFNIKQEFDEILDDYDDSNYLLEPKIHLEEDGISSFTGKVSIPAVVASWGGCRNTNICEMYH